MAAAGTSPTISTFLELRDNMSAGLKNVTSEINRLNQAAKDAEDAIRRMKAAQGARPPRPPAPPAPPPPRGPRAPGAPGAPSGRPDQLFRFEGGIFNAVTRANLLVDAIEGAVMGATRAVAGLLKYTVKVGEEYEKTQLSLTNTLTSMALSPSIQAGQKRSLELMSQMRALAAKLPGEAKDYINAFALTLPEAIAAGERDTKKYADFISHYMAVALTKGMDAPQAGRDLVEMLQGRAHLRTATYQKLRVQIGMLATEFNKLTPEERYRRITSAIAQSGSGMAFAAETANAKFGELKSRLEEIAAIGGKPFFEAVKSSVTEINKFLQENNVLINSITQSIATGMGDALRGVVSYMKDIVSLAASYKDEILLAVDFLKASYQTLGLVSSAASAIAGRGKESRLQEEQAAKAARAARISKVMAAYPEAEKMLPEVRAPSGMLDVSTVNKEYRESLKKTLKEMWITSKGKMADIFKTSEDWATFVEAKGTAWGIDPQSLWDEMVAEKKIKIPVIEAKTRELKVEFNNNRFDIHQQFAEGFDPDRIAVAFASDLARAGEMKVQAAFSPIYGAGQ